MSVNFRNERLNHKDPRKYTRCFGPDAFYRIAGQPLVQLRAGGEECLVFGELEWPPTALDPDDCFFSDSLGVALCR